MKLLLCIVYIAVLGLMSHFVGEALPRDMFDPDKFPYKQFSWEKSGRVYKVLKVKRWKKLVPDASKYFKNMVPKTVSKGMDSERINLLILETCVAEFIHLLLCVASMGVCIIWEGSAGFFIWELCVVGNMIFVVIQRYNRPLLVRLRDRLRSREGKLEVCEY